jgi:hypothetical protein
MMFLSQCAICSFTEKAYVHCMQFRRARQAGTLLGGEHPQVLLADEQDNAPCSCQPFMLTEEVTVFMLAD